MTGADPARRPAVIVVGSSMVDMVAYATRIPAAGETLVGQRFDLGFGGKGANQAVMAARLGARVSMVNAVGDDAFGPMTIENLAAQGVDVRHVIPIAGASTGAAPIWVTPDGSNRILIIAGANDRMDAAMAAAAVASAEAVDVVVGQLEIPQAVTAAAFRAARDRGAITVLNPAPAAELLPELRAATDWLVPNEVEFGTLAAAAGLDGSDALDVQTLRAVRGAEGPGLVVTLGAAGAVAIGTAGEVVRITAAPVTAIDTTGAGDAFVGAFAVAIARGARLEIAIRTACAIATDSVGRRGTQASFPDAEAAARLALDSGLPPIDEHLPH